MSEIGWLIGMLAVGGVVGVALAADPLPLPAVLNGVTRIGFYGDSLTDGSDFPEIVINTLNKAYPGHGFSFFNAAICGQKSFELVERLDRDVLSQEPDLTFIMIGTNDSNGSNPPIQFKADLMYLARRLKTAGSRVAFIALSGSTNPEMAARLEAYDAIIRDVARQEGAMLVDAWEYFAQRQAAGTEMYYAPGDAHHSQEGFRSMARVILNTLGVPETVAMELAITPPPGLLTHWEESGPVTPPTPQTPVTPDLVTEWTPYDFGAWINTKDWSWKPIAQRGAWFTLQGDAKGRTAFARTTYQAANAGLYELQLGGTAPLRVWVNGVPVFSLGKSNGHHPNAVRTPVLLKAGANTIVITTSMYAYAGVKSLE